MDKNNVPRHVKSDNSRKTRNILIAVIVSLFVILLAILIPLTFCSRQDMENIAESGPEEGVGDEGIIDRITDEYIELDVEGKIIIIYLDGYRSPEELSVGDRLYVKYKVDKNTERNIIIYLKILEKANQPDEPNIIRQVGLIDRIDKDSIYLKISDSIVLIYLDGYRLPNDLTLDDKVFVEYEVDKNAEQNILKNLEVLEKVEVSEAPKITLEIYEGPEYLEKDNICYYRIKAVVTGKPFPEISWSRDDSGGNLGPDKAQINLKDVDDKYSLEAIAKNREGTAKTKVEIKWGCKKPPINKPPEIKEIVIMEDFYTGTEYPVYVIAKDLDGDELSYKWSVSAGTVRKSSSNPMFWTTPTSEGTYEITVTVDDGNNGVATKKENVNVEQEGVPQEPPEEEELTDITWQWERFISNDGKQTIIIDPEQYMLFLDSDENMYLLSDCNSGSGTYTEQNDRLTINIDIITQAICGPESLSDDYISYLIDVVSYVLEDKELYLDLKLETGSMVFGQGWE